MRYAPRRVPGRARRAGAVRQDDGEAVRGIRGIELGDDAVVQAPPPRVGSVRRQDALQAVEDAKRDLEDYRDSVEIHRELGPKGFAEGWRRGPRRIRGAHRFRRAVIAHRRPFERKRDDMFSRLYALVSAVRLWGVAVDKHQVRGPASSDAVTQGEASVCVRSIYALLEVAQGGRSACSSTMPLVSSKRYSAPGVSAGAARIRSVAGP